MPRLHDPRHRALVAAWLTANDLAGTTAPLCMHRIVADRIET
jgi:hypothetical protein